MSVIIKIYAASQSDPQTRTENAEQGKIQDLASEYWLNSYDTPFYLNLWWKQKDEDEHAPLEFWLFSIFVLLTFTPNITRLQHQEPGSCNCDLHQCSLLTQFVHCLLLTRCNVCVRKIEESWSSIRFLKHISAYQHNISTHISDVNPEIKYIATEISRTLPQAIFHQVNCETSMGSPVWEQLAILSNQVPLKYRLPLNFLF